MSGDGISISGLDSLSIEASQSSEFLLFDLA